MRPQRALRGREPVDVEVPAEIDRVGGVFRQALRRGFSSASDASVAAWVQSLPRADQSVAVEGVAMAVAWMQRATRSDRTWEGLSAALDDEHAVGLALGLGWALSWLGASPDAEMVGLPPLVRWRVVDGYGFRDGLVAPRRHVLRTMAPKQIEGFGQAVWRQGLGRSLWYTTRGDVGEVRDVVNAFPSPVRPELWTGVGVAATWIGCSSQPPMARLRTAAGHDAHWLALGAALAARTARDSGSLTARQAAPCRALADGTPEELAIVTDRAEAALPLEADTPLFQRWKDDIASRLA